ncbi:hypothetical protein PC39_02260 [Salinisphaera sp. PC39]
MAATGQLRKLFDPKAARHLGISFRALRYRLKKLGIE